MAFGVSYLPLRATVWLVANGSLTERKSGGFIERYKAHFGGSKVKQKKKSLILLMMQLHFLANLNSDLSLALFKMVKSNLDVKNAFRKVLQNKMCIWVTLYFLLNTSQFMCVIFTRCRMVL